MLHTFSTDNRVASIFFETSELWIIANDFAQGTYKQDRGFVRKSASKIVIPVRILSYRISACMSLVQARLDEALFGRG